MVVDDIDFSFYFSRKNANHGPRIKIYWDSSKTSQNFDGYIELHGDYKYVSSSKPQHKPSSWDIRGLQYFCQKYKALFTAVWEEKLNESDLQNYFKGYISFKELLTKFKNISEIQYFLINHCHSLKELNTCIREHNIYKMYD